MDARLDNTTKEQLINLFLKSERIRKRQNEMIMTLIKELQEYEDIAIEKMLNDM